jgi:sarcosine oxidase subunit beta
MTHTADAIVIGAGIHGCSTALHLALRGVKALVIEKDYAGRHASGVNAGGVRQLARHLAEVPLSVASMEIWERIRDIVDDDCGFEAHGQVLIAESETELDGCRTRVDDLRLRGFRHEELLDRTQLRHIVPAAAEHCVGGIVSRRDGAANPFRTTQAFRRKAIALGARFLEGISVINLRRQGRAWRLETTHGSFEAANVVNAAGAWADHITAQVGEPVPLQVIAPMLMITAPMPSFITPVVILRGRKLSFKQFANGTVLIGGGHLGRPFRNENRTELDWHKLSESTGTVAELFPIMAGSTIVRAWAGIEARMPDDIPVIGPSHTSEGIFHQFGFSAHGFQLGPGVGALMAELITTGATNAPIEPFRIQRFSEPQRSEHSQSGRQEPMN